MNNVSLHTYNPAFIKFIENIALCNFNELTIYSKNKKGNHFDLLNINFKKNSKFILIGNFTKDDFSVILRSKPSLLLYIEENFNRDIFLNSKNLSVEEVFQNNDFVELGYLFGNLSNSFSFISNNFYNYDQKINFVTFNTDDFLINSSHLEKLASENQKWAQLLCNHKISIISENKKGVDELQFFKTSINRKDSLKVSTAIIKNSDSLYVRKYFLTDNKKHRENIVAISESLANINNLRFSNIIKNSDAENYLDFEYIDGQNINILMQKTLLKSDLISFDEIFKKYIRFVDVLNEALINNSDDFTLFDLNFDNIIIKNSNLYLIDYEWKAPIDFSRLSITRALYYFFLTNQQIILSNYQLQPGIKITKNLVVPEIFYNLTNRYLGIDDIDRFFEFEKQIQSNVGTKNLNQDKVKDSERIIIPKYYSLTEQLVISVEENVRLKSEKTDILNKLSIAENELDRIKQSKTWKLISTLRKFIPFLY